MTFLRKTHLPRLVLLLLICGLPNLTACTQKFISSYDEKTDNAVTALQRSVEGFLVNLENSKTAPECTHEHQKAFYNSMKVEISALKVRTDAIDKNELTSKQVAALSDSLKSLEQLHEIKQPAGKCFTREEIEPLRQNLNITFSSILKLELAKKREGYNSSESK